MQTSEKYKSGLGYYLIIVPETFSLFSYCFSRAELHVCGVALSDRLRVSSVFVILLSDTIRISYTWPQ